MSEAAYLNYDDNYYNYTQVISDELKLSTQIAEYLLEWIKSIDIKTKPVVFRKIINNDNILYIHGKALNNERLIIGHHNVFAYAGKQPLLMTYLEMNGLSIK